MSNVVRSSVQGSLRNSVVITAVSTGSPEHEDKNSPPIIKRKNSEVLRKPLKRGESVIEPTRKQTDKFRSTEPDHFQGLNLMIKELEAKCAELELEKTKILSQQNSINNEHKEEIASLRRDIKMLRDDKDRAHKRLTKSQLIDGAIIGLYLEVKDRSTDPPDQEPDLELEAEKLRGQSPLVVLDLLRAELKSLLAFKEEYENELKSDMRRKKTHLEVQNDELKRNIKEMSESIEEYKRDTAAALEKSKAALAQFDKLTNEKRQIQEKAELEIRDSKDHVEKLKTEIESLQRQLYEKDRTIRDKDVQLRKVVEYEHEIETIKTKHRREVARIQKMASWREDEKKQTDDDKLAVTEQENRKLEAKLKWANEQIYSLAKNAPLDDLKQHEKLALALEKQKEATKRAETEVRKTKIIVNELTKKNEELKKEIKINKAAKAYLKAHDHEKLDASGHYHKDDPNHSTIEVVKKQLQQKEQELQQVNGRLRRMLFVWNRGQLMKKSAHVERENMASEIEQLRLELASTKQTRMSSSGINPLETLERPNSVEDWMNTTHDDYPALETADLSDEDGYLSPTEDDNSESISPSRFKTVNRASSFPNLHPSNSDGWVTTPKKKNFSVGSNHSTLLVGNLVGSGRY